MIAARKTCISGEGANRFVPESRIYMRVLDNLPDGVLMVGHDRKIIYANDAFIRIWRVPEALIELRDDIAILEHVLGQLSDPDQFIQEVERLYGTRESSEDEIVFKDGRIISRRSMPCSDRANDFSRIWIFTDITEAMHARVDPLTNLATRRIYNRFITAFAHESVASDKVKALAVIDIDRFKEYNDTLGHAAGDRLLESLGEIFSVRTGGKDAAFRIGGDEFVIGGYYRDQSSAAHYFRNLQNNVLGMGIAHPDNRPFDKATISIGVAITRNAVNHQDFFFEADTALRSAKEAGRNAIRFAAI
jgi:diguanylate cyclase (GGDEF)-like protein